MPRASALRPRRSTCRRFRAGSLLHLGHEDFRGPHCRITCHHRPLVLVSPRGPILAFHPLGSFQGRDPSPWQRGSPAPVMRSTGFPCQSPIDWHPGNAEPQLGPSGCCAGFSRQPRIDTSPVQEYYEPMPVKSRTPRRACRNLAAGMVVWKVPRRHDPNMVDDAQVRKALEAVLDPELNRNLIELGMVREVQIASGHVGVTVALTTPSCPLTDQIETDVKRAVMALPGVE